MFDIVVHSQPPLEWNIASPRVFQGNQDDRPINPQRKAESAGAFPNVFHFQEKPIYKLMNWVWLKINQGQTAGVGNQVSTYRSGNPFWNSGFLVATANGFVQTPNPAGLTTLKNRDLPKCLTEQGTASAFIRTQMHGFCRREPDIPKEYLLTHSPGPHL